jgi:hypothetical protein
MHKNQVGSKMTKGKGDNMGWAKDECHQLEKGRNMKGKPMKNNAKRENE